MNRQAVDMTQLKLLVEAGMTSYAIAIACNWSLEHIRTMWADHLEISVFRLIGLEQELDRLPRLREVRTKSWERSQ